MNAKHRKQIEPRLLSREQAATYCGVSAPTFISECPVTPIKIRTRVLYDRRSLDRWLDSLSADEAKSLSREKWLALLDGDHAA